MKFVKVLKAGKPTKEEMIKSLTALTSSILGYHQDMQNASVKPENEDSVTKILEHIDQTGNLIYKLK